MSAVDPITDYLAGRQANRFVPEAVACTATIDLGVIPNEADIDRWLSAF
ncbi:MAG: hypothetical protein V2I51_06405 [Anderseniella sp.]|jgi:hypothetical protein|nr:hypothetical protein [Anderseniella sp.]